MKFKLITESFKFYTDGVKTIKVYDGQNPPEGFTPGRTFNSNPWNKGLTKETDDRVKANSVATSIGLKGSTPWNKGLTKYDNASLQIVSDKVSRAMIGNAPWNKNLTKDTDDRLKQSGIKQSTTKLKNPPKSWSKGLTKDTDERIKRISDKLKGHESFVTDWGLQKEKEYHTKKKNNSFNISKPEEDLIKELKLEFGEDDVINPYRDDRYPFNCDAYIVSKDLFIELNATWYHGPHPFNEDNPEDIELLNSWKEKAELKPKSYNYAIYIWTISDPKKLDTFRQNNLNFKIIYPKENLIIDK